MFDYSAIQNFLSAVSVIHPFHDASSPTIGKIYSNIDKNVINYMLSRSFNNHGDLEKLRTTKEGIFTSSPYPKTDAFFRGKIINGFRIASLLESILGDSVYSNHLDIASGNGLLSYALRSIGVTKNSDNIDILDRSSDCREPYRVIQELANLILADNFTSQSIPPEIYTGAGYEVDAFNQMIYSSKLINNFNNCLYPDKTETVTSSENIFHVGNFLTYDNFDKEYDLITVYSAINYFESSLFFSKLKQLSKTGTVVVCINDMFSEIMGGGMHLPLILPWMHLLFSKPQIIDIYSKYLGIEAGDYINLAYYYPDSHITSAIQRKNAELHGFKLIHQSYTTIPVNGRLQSQSPSLYLDKIIPICTLLNQIKPGYSLTPQEMASYYQCQVFMCK